MADEQRDVVKYTFLKIDPHCFDVPRDERERNAQEFAALLEHPSQRVNTYSTVGLRGDCDLLVWHAAATVDEIQQAEARWRSARLSPYLQVTHSFLAMMRRSPYLGGHRHPGQEGSRSRLRAAGDRYLFVYPMWKKRAWYRLPFEKRKAMMVEHFAIGHRFPSVKINTGYSFGLDDQEFVVAFECDDPAVFLDLVMALRESQASRYTERETPIFTCVKMEAIQVLRLALGLADESLLQSEESALQSVSLVSG
jgi:chlorite dismutase